MGREMNTPLKVKKEFSGGAFLVSANRDGFPRTLARCYDEETADLLIAAIKAPPPGDVVCRLPELPMAEPVVKGVKRGKRPS